MRNLSVGALLFASAVLVFAAYLALLYFSMVFWHGVLASLLLALIVLICTGIGRIALRLLGISELSQSERTLIGCTLGLGLLTQGIFALGILGLLRLWAVLFLLSVFWVAGFTEMRDVLKSLLPNANLLKDRGGWISGLALFLSLALWTSWVPPHQYDSLVYHLSLASEYVRAGRIIPVDYLIYSHFPQNGEMLFTLSLLFGSDILAQMFSWLALFLSFLWVLETGKREMPLTATLFAGLLVVSHTAAMLLAATSYVETLAMLWVTASVLSFCRWAEIADSKGGRGWLLLAAAFAGLGIGTKYYVGICPAILELMIFWVDFQASRRRRLRQWGGDMLSFFAVTVLCAAPWLIRNWATVGNPVFPFLYNALPHHGVPWGAENARRYFSMLTEYGHKGHFWTDLLHFPLLVVSGDLKYGGGMDVLGNLGWGALAAFFPAAVWVARKNATFRLVVVYCLLHGCVWFYTGSVLRFLVVLVAIASLPAAAGVFQCWKALNGFGRKLLVTSAAILIATNLGLFLYAETLFSSWTVLLGIDSREEFLTRKLDYYACARYARDNLGKNDKILIVGEQRGYYVEQEHVATSPMAPNRFVEWANESPDPDAFAKRLKDDGGFTYLLIVPREAQRLNGYGVFAFNERGSTNWRGLEDGRVKEVYAPGPCALVKIL